MTEPAPSKPIKEIDILWITAGLGGSLATVVPDFQRYMKIRSM